MSRPIRLTNLQQIKMSNKLNEISQRSKNRILSRLKAASKDTDGSIQSHDRSVRVFPDPQPLLETFVSEFEKVNGEVHICKNDTELTEQLEELIRKNGWKNILCRDTQLQHQFSNSFESIDESDFGNVEVGITRCEFLIARSGSIMVSSAHESGRLLNVFPPVHIVVAQASQLVAYLEDAIENFKHLYGTSLPSQATVITGPSRTADIEKTLVMGAHGPKELILLLRK